MEPSRDLYCHCPLLGPFMLPVLSNRGSQKASAVFSGVNSKKVLFDNVFSEQLSSPVELKSNSTNDHKKNEGQSFTLWHPTDKQSLLEVISSSEIVRVSFSQK